MPRFLANAIGDVLAGALTPRAIHSAAVHALKLANENGYDGGDPSFLEEVSQRLRELVLTAKDAAHRARLELAERIFRDAAAEQHDVKRLPPPSQRS